MIVTYFADFLAFFFVEAYEKERRMRYVTSVERIGIRKGEQRGIEKGRKEGKVALLKNLLLHQFAELPGWAEKLLNDASLDDLDRWSVKVLDANSLEDVFVTA